MIKILFTIQPRGLLTQVCDELMRNSFTFFKLAGVTKLHTYITYGLFVSFFQE